MPLLFQNELHDEFGTWALGYIPYGGADFGEVQAVAKTVGNGDSAAFYNAWMAAGDRLAQQATTQLASGHRASAQASLLRASVFYASSYHPLYGTPVDPRLTAAFRKQVAAFDRAMALARHPVVPLSIPFANTPMPAYLIPALGRETEVRPLLICTNGYDASITDMYCASAVAASQRGYHCLLFDGPGQGAMLIEHGVHLRPDWETVVTAVVDFALALPHVDAARIALNGWSLGGYLAPRAASGEHRLAACIADPGLWGIADGVRSFAIKFGATPAQAADVANLDQAIVDRMWAGVTVNPRLRWKFEQRGFWVHGVGNLRDYLKCAVDYTLDSRAADIRCPTLLTTAEGDVLAEGAQAFFDALQCPKTLLHFTAAEGAGGHCEMMNRSLLNRRTFDWLDDVFATS